MVQSYVRPHKWRLGKDGRHPGYYRKKRPKGKKRIIGKKPQKLYPIYNEYHERLGWKRKK